MSKELSYNDIRDSYRDLARVWDFVASPMEFLTGFKQLRRELAGRAYGKVLELGAGTGRNFQYYSDKCEISALDLSEEMLKKAIEKARELGKKVNFSVGSAEDLKFDDNSFDCVVESLALCTYIDPIKALKEMRRVCRKNGKILLLEHGISNNSLVRKLQNWREKGHYEKLGCHLIRNPFELVRKAGLHIEEERNYGLGKSIYFIEARP